MIVSLLILLLLTISVTLEEFKWNFKRLLREGYPEVRSKLGSFAFVYLFFILLSVVHEADRRKANEQFWGVL